MWVFCYGSLMWDKWEKAYGCTSRQKATLVAFRRAFGKGSIERWGTKEHPGPTVILVRDSSAECTGVVFDFPDEREPDVLKYLAKREGDKFDLSQQNITLAEGLTVLAKVPMYSGKSRVRATSLQSLAKMILGAKGTAGSCYDYVKNLNELLAAEGIDDPAVNEVWGAVQTEKPLVANAAADSDPNATEGNPAATRYDVSFTTSPSFVQLFGTTIVIEYRTEAGKAEYKLRFDAPKHCHWIGPIAAPSGEEACDLARHVLNLYLDKLSVQSGTGWVINYDHRFQNLDLETDRGRIVGVQVSKLSGESVFPDRVAVSDDLVSAAYYRQGMTAAEPFEQYRNFYLSIEEVGKRIRKSLDPNAHAESTVLEDTVEEVFGKTQGPDLQAFRGELPEGELPVHFQGGRGHAKQCLNEFFYHMYRCALMHSGKTKKPNTSDEKDTFAPFKPVDAASVGNVVPLVAKLARRFVMYDIDNPP